MGWGQARFWLVGVRARCRNPERSEETRGGWRKRVGVEPIRDEGTRPSPVLKLRRLEPVTRFFLRSFGVLRDLYSDDCASGFTTQIVPHDKPDPIFTGRKFQA